MTYPPKDMLTMWDRVNDVLTTGQDFWNSNDAICNAALRFRLLRNEIIDVIEADVVADATGSTTIRSVDAEVPGTPDPRNNNAAKEAAITTALPIAAAIRKWAIQTDNDGIARNMEINASEFQDMRDTYTADRLRLVHTTGISNMGELARYGIGQPALDELMGKIRAYETVNPRSIANRWTSVNEEGGEFDEIIRDGMALLNETLDPEVERLADRSPEFVEAYKAARSGLDTGPSHVPPTLGKL